MIGLGDSHHSGLNVYTANRPPLDEYQQLDELKPLVKTEVTFIANQTGNHWRKVFNVFAKFIYALDDSYQEKSENNASLEFSTWQAYRDERLLQKGSAMRLLFSPLNISELNSEQTVHIIMGKQYAVDLGFHEDRHEGMYRLDQDFAIWPEKKLIVCPYFDYRQLSNAKIERLKELVKSIH